MSTAPDARRKDARFAMRLTADQSDLIRSAAAAAGQSLTEFATMAVVGRAIDTLADRRAFRLDAERWAEFVAVLDRPARPVPELALLLQERAPWEDG